MSNQKKSLFTPGEIAKILESIDTGDFQTLVLLAQDLKNSQHPRQTIYEGVEKYFAKKNKKKAKKLVLA